MMTLVINEQEYKVKFGYNSFADSDLLENVQNIANLLSGTSSDEEVVGIGKMRELFSTVRELLYVGFMKYNPVSTVQDVGNLLDDYMEQAQEPIEGEEKEDRGVLALFIMLANELANEGFLADFVEKMMATEKSQAKAIPQDHKKSTKKK